jgi:polar amino acid transport system substrate-binding protein
LSRRRLASLGAAVLGLPFVMGSARAQSGPASTWDAIKKRGSILLGATQAEPWYFKDPLSGKWDGVALRITDDLAKALGVKVEVVETTWGNAVAALQAGQIDLMYVLDATPERAVAIDFIQTPLLYYALAVLHRPDLKAADWADLDSDKVSISVSAGTSIERFLTETVKNAKQIRLPTNDEVVAAFQSGRSDAAAMFHPALMMLQKKVGMGTLTLPKPVLARRRASGCGGNLTRPGATTSPPRFSSTIRTAASRSITTIS